MPGCIVLVHKTSGSTDRETLLNSLHLVGFLPGFCFVCDFGFDLSLLYLKVKNNSKCSLFNGCTEENLVVNNKLK